MAVRDERGTASVEAAGLIALIALLAIVAIAAIAAGGEIDRGRTLGATIGKRLTCGPRAPGACRHHDLVNAYGRPLAGLVRALAPPPQALPGPGGEPLVAVDFRRCRRVSCAIPDPARPDLGLTASRRRATAFTQVADRRRSGGGVEVSYWLYRPTLGWERIRHLAGPEEIAAAAGTPVLATDSPALVPLEILPGRDHYEFPAAEEPPWRWQVRGLYPGWSA